MTLTVQDRRIVRRVIDRLAQPRPRSTRRRCCYCGWPAVGSAACSAHADLLLLDREREQAA